LSRPKRKEEKLRHDTIVVPSTYRLRSRSALSALSSFYPCFGSNER